MKADSSRIDVLWHQPLEEVLRHCASVGSAGVLAFDLDSTLFDNRPRQARIVREFGATKGLPALTKCQPFHFESGWDLRGAMLACGLSDADATLQQRELKAFWGSRFFSSAYCLDDVEILGAPRFLARCVATGVKVAYVTGRHEAMRLGTEACLAKCGFPVPGTGVGLMMKPSASQDDDGYKRVAHEVLAGWGQVVAAFDNEPTHINDYAQRFAECVPVHLATDHSGKVNTFDPRVVSVPHFAW
jgi:hypothetical protein